MYLFFQLESPSHVKLPYKKFDGFFNATVSYRLNSTFRYPYSSIADVEAKHGKAGSLKTWKPGKKEFGAIVAFSNCKAKFRNDLIQRLDELIVFPDGKPALDVVGKCAKFVETEESRKAKNTREEALGMDFSNRWAKLPVGRYRFYLSIENSKCRDYITENFFYNALLKGAVPIVYGPPREDYRAGP